MGKWKFLLNGRVPDFEATWESACIIQQRFPDLHLKDKLDSTVGRNGEKPLLKVGGREVIPRTGGKTPTPQVTVELGQVLLRTGSKKVVPVRRAWLGSLEHFIPRAAKLAVPLSISHLLLPN